MRPSLRNCSRGGATTTTPLPLSLPRYSTRAPFSADKPLSDHPILPLLQKAHSHLRHQPRPDLRPLLSHAIASGSLHHPFAASRVVELFLRHDPPYARAIFDSLGSPDAYTWNALLLAHPDPLAHFCRMLRTRTPPTSHTFAILLKSSSSAAARHPSFPGNIHSQALRRGADGHLVVRNSLLRLYFLVCRPADARLLFDTSPFLDAISWNSMISGYAKLGLLEPARHLFDEMPERNLVSWSALIDAYVRAGAFAEALRVFRRMQLSGIRPDVVTLVSALKACAQLGALYQGRWIHIYVEKWELGREGNVVLSTALIDMYAKCGCIDHALKVFGGVENGDVVLWNAVIGALAMHGQGREALGMFAVMKAQGLAPNETTFINLLCACTHARMVEEGLEIFESMKGCFGIEPQREHYGCLVDLFGRAGMVQEAEEVLRTMPMEPEASQWGALMAACRTHGNVEVGERVGRHLISLKPFDGGCYVSLFNVYAGAGHWEDAVEMRGVMDEKGAKKERGCSFVEWNGVIHEFYVGDTSHPQSRDIYATLSEMERRLKIAGYVQDTSPMLIEMCDQEEKELALSYHSERLAIAFGIINIGHETPIRIVKNLRICRDCHNYTKFVSKVYQREIVVRDRKRFHIFREGSCSCMDYW